MIYDRSFHLLSSVYVKPYQMSFKIEILSLTNFVCDMLLNVCTEYVVSSLSC